MSIYFARNLCTYGSDVDQVNYEILLKEFNVDPTQVETTITKPEDVFNTSEEFWDKVESVLTKCSSFVLFPMVSAGIQTIGFCSYVELGLVANKIPVYVYDASLKKFATKYDLLDVTPQDYEVLKITDLQYSVYDGGGFIDLDLHKSEKSISIQEEGMEIRRAAMPWRYHKKIFCYNT